MKPIAFSLIAMLGFAGPAVAHFPFAVPSGGRFEWVLFNAWGRAPPAEVIYPEPPPVAPRDWLTQWGAIAVDEGSRSVGTSTQVASQPEAEREALQLCAREGGGGCKIVLVYRDQCGVLARGGDVYASARGPDVPGASDLALEQCTRSAADCEIAYTDCAYPVPVY